MNGKKSLYIVVAIMLTVSLLFAETAEQGFVPLFNGRDLNGWKAAEGWGVKDGILVTDGKDSGDLFTEKEYGNFILRFDYMVSKVGNSGVLVRFGPDRNRRDAFEVQILAPWTPYRDDLHCTGSMYGFVAVTNRPDETIKVWHPMEVVCDRRYVVVSVNGAPASWAHLDQVPGMLRKNLVGAIGFQGNHSDSTEWVKFRNIRIRNLDLEPDYVLQGFSLTDPVLRKLNYQSALSLGAKIAPGLCGLYEAGDSVSAPVARQALFAIASELSTPPGARAARDSLAVLLKDRAAKSKKEEVRNYLEWVAGMLNACK